MKAKRFVAKDMRRSLELVRQNLGEDAVILSTRRIKDGVEILASCEEGPATPAMDLAAEVHSQPAFAGQSDKAAKSGAEILADIELASRRLAARQVVDDSANEYLGEHQIVNAGIRIKSSSQRQEPQPARPAVRFQSAAERYGLLETEDESGTAKADATEDNRADITHLQEEILQMRQLLEQQLSALAPPGSPRIKVAGGNSGIAQRLLNMGFSERVINALLKKPLKNRLMAKAWPEAMARLAKAIPVYSEDITEKGGIFAFVGPTGAGKTTTVAKLAARYVMQHGADKVALVTTDTQRLAAHDQLRSLASILKVPLRVVDENNSLPKVLRSLRNVELVLIDTAGLRHGDPVLKQQMKALALIPRVRSFLVLPANSQLQMLKASLHAYNEASLEGCVLSKLDETASLGEAVDCAIQAKLPIAYTTDGQEIPEDIAVAKGPNLLSRAASLANGLEHKEYMRR